MKDYSEVEGITTVPGQNPVQELSKFIRHNLPAATYEALAQLFTYSVLADGTDGVVNLDVSRWTCGQVSCVRCWCKKMTLRSRLERDPITNKFFLSMRK